MASDPGSLLNHYRTLIRLRDSSEALGSGTFIPLDAGTWQLAAYLRCTADRVALVVANLGTTELWAVAVSSGMGALPEGRFVAADGLGGAVAAPLDIGADGQIQGYIPLPVIAPLTASVFELEADGG